MWIRRMVSFIFGLLLSTIAIYLVATQGVLSDPSLLPIVPFDAESTQRFVTIDHSTIVNRNKFSEPTSAKPKVKFVLGDTGVVPLAVAGEFKNSNSSLNVEIPAFEHVKVNESYIGRIEIPALSISDSFYFTGDDFFLRRDWKGNSSNAGELYIDGRSSGNLFRLDNLINGHNMNSGTKFARLNSLKSMQGPIYVFINEHSTGKTFIYQVFAARTVTNDDTGVHLNFSSTFVRKQYYQTQIENSVFETIPVDFTSPILTLNTCDSSIKNGHFLVFAVLVGWE